MEKKKTRSKDSIDDLMLTIREFASLVKNNGAGNESTHPIGGTLHRFVCVLLTMRRMDLHAFHGSRHCWHDCHAVERHVECVSVRILKVTAAHRSSCRPHDTRRRLKTFFGTFLRGTPLEHATLLHRPVVHFE